MLPIFLDHQATTPLDPDVLEAMLPALHEPGNPASARHEYGRRASDRVEHARRQVAGLVGALREQVVFTSGATESDQLAVQAAAGHGGAGVVSCVTEHSAVLEPLAELARNGARVTLLEVDGDGHLDLAELRRAVDDETVLVSLMAANNEIGTLHPLEAAAEIAHRHAALLHVDAAQAVGRVPIDIAAIGIDLLSLSGHKLHGPQGVGALVVADPRTLTPQRRGGGQEHGLRGGTVNVAGCVGLGHACQIAQDRLATEPARLSRLADHLLRTLRDQLDATLNGPVRRLPGNLNVTIPGVDAEALIANCPGVAIATRSACATHAGDSYVLRAIGLASDESDETIRLGVGRFTTQADVDEAGRLIVAAALRVREATSPEVAA